MLKKGYNIVMTEVKRGLDILKRNALHFGLILALLLIGAGYLQIARDIHELNGQVGQLNGEVHRVKNTAARSSGQAVSAAREAPQTTAQPVTPPTPSATIVYKTMPAPAAAATPAPTSTATATATPAPPPASQPSTPPSSYPPPPSPQNPPQPSPQPLVCILGLLCI